MNSVGMQTLKREGPWVRVALLYEKLEGKGVKCGLCERRCVIPPDKLGFCKTRQNRDGELYTLQYGLSSGISANPIKKPFYHSWPGSVALTIATANKTI